MLRYESLRQWTSGRYLADVCLIYGNAVELLDIVKCMQAVDEVFAPTLPIQLTDGKAIAIYPVSRSFVVILIVVVFPTRIVQHLHESDVCPREDSDNSSIDRTVLIPGYSSGRIIVRKCSAM